MWQPEIGPTANAMASNERPNAMATPTLPTFPPAITAVVNPAKTRTNVPNSSAAYFMRLSPRENFGKTQNGQQSAGTCDDLAANPYYKCQLRCQREFYMAEVVLARIHAGARLSVSETLKDVKLPNSLMNDRKRPWHHRHLSPGAALSI
jgi:hypothetical protein